MTVFGIREGKFALTPFLGTDTLLSMNTTITPSQVKRIRNVVTHLDDMISPEDREAGIESLCTLLVEIVGPEPEPVFVIDDGIGLVALDVARDLIESDPGTDDPRVAVRDAVTDLMTCLLHNAGPDASDLLPDVPVVESELPIGTPVSNGHYPPMTGTVIAPPRGSMIPGEVWVLWYDDTVPYDYCAHPEVVCDLVVTS